MKKKTQKHILGIYIICIYLLNLDFKFELKFGQFYDHEVLILELRIELNITITNYIISDILLVFITKMFYLVHKNIILYLYWFQQFYNLLF